MIDIQNTRFLLRVTFFVLLIAPFFLLPYTFISTFDPASPLLQFTIFLEPSYPREGRLLALQELFHPPQPSLHLS